jgi:hypothetical protein
MICVIQLGLGAQKNEIHKKYITDNWGMNNNK